MSQERRSSGYHLPHEDSLDESSYDDGEVSESWEEDEEIDPTDSASTSQDRAPPRRRSAHQFRSHNRPGGQRIPYRQGHGPIPGSMEPSEYDASPYGRGGFGGPGPYGGGFRGHHGYPQSNVGFGGPSPYGPHDQMVPYNFPPNPFSPMSNGGAGSYFGDPRDHYGQPYRGHHAGHYGNYPGAGYGVPAHMQQYLQTFPPAPPPTDVMAPKPATPAPPASEKPPPPDPEMEKLKAELEQFKKEQAAKQAAEEAARVKKQAMEDAAREIQAQQEAMRKAQEEAARAKKQAMEDAARELQAREEAMKKAQAEKEAEVAAARKEAERAAKEAHEAEMRAAEERKRLHDEEMKRVERLAREKAEAEMRAKAEAEREKEEAAKRAKEEAELKLQEMLLKIQLDKEEAERKKAEAEAEAKKKEAALKEEAARAERAKIEKEAADAAAAAAAEKAEKDKEAEWAKKVEEAKKEAAAKPEPDLTKSIKFKDAVGRKFSFPFHICEKWTGMEELIRQAFMSVEVIGQQVMAGHYDLLGPDNEIILPTVWEKVIQPDWQITMVMWPPPERAGPRFPPGRHGHPAGAPRGDPRDPRFQAAMRGRPGGGGGPIPPPPPGGLHGRMPGPPPGFVRPGGGARGPRMPPGHEPNVVQVGPSPSPERGERRKKKHDGGNNFINFLAGKQAKPKKSKHRSRDH